MTKTVTFPKFLMPLLWSNFALGVVLGGFEVHNGIRQNPEIGFFSMIIFGVFVVLGVFLNLMIHRKKYWAVLAFAFLFVVSFFPEVQKSIYTFNIALVYSIGKIIQIITGILALRILFKSKNLLLFWKKK